MPAQYGIDNIRIANFSGCGVYDIPPIAATNFIPDCGEWIGFNYANTCKRSEEKSIHFFLDDYQFLRVWRDPTRYAEMLKRFKYVLSPDFSLFTDYPKAMMIYNHYRKHWIAAYWQAVGIRVIPTITWADESSFDFCFDGEPTNAVVAVSSVGTQKNKVAKEIFLKGYDAMLERIEPKAILFFGNIPNGMKGNIIQIPTFYKKFEVA